jgi:hypothetical protein
MKLDAMLVQLYRSVPDFTVIDLDVSKGSVGWHISHTALVANGVITALNNSNPATYRAVFNWKRSYIFLMGKIPRNKIQSPASVIPPQLITESTLRSQLIEMQQSLASLDNIAPAYYFNHPFLGHLNKKQTIRFLEIHTQHHLNIIKDILN